jgi:hypothetical protein
VPPATAPTGREAGRNTRALQVGKQIVARRDRHDHQKRQGQNAFIPAHSGQGAAGTGQFSLEYRKQNIASSESHSATEAPTAIAKTDFPYISPYINNGWTSFFDPNGYPAIKPPWGTLNAIDLNTGEYLWRVPLGEFPELTKKGIPDHRN